MKKKIYELVLVLPASVGEKDVEKMGSDLLEKNGAKKISYSFWGKKDLTYPIKKNVSGMYGFWEVDMEPAVAIELSNKLRLNEGLLRYLLVSKIVKEEKESKPKSKPAKSKSVAKKS